MSGKSVELDREYELALAEIQRCDASIAKLEAEIQRGYDELAEFWAARDNIAGDFWTVRDDWETETGKIYPVATPVFTPGSEYRDSRLILSELILF